MDHPPQKQDAGSKTASDDAARKPAQNVPAGTPDATRRDIILYAFGNVEGAIANQFFTVLNQILVVAMMVNPLFIGLIGALRTLWDAITDPVMAYVTDNTRSRWGRRRPYILVGGVSRIAVLVLIVWFLPTGGRMISNPVMEAQKFVNEGIQAAGEARQSALDAIADFPGLPPKARATLLQKVEKKEREATESGAAMKNSLVVLEEDLAARRALLAETDARLAGLTPDTAEFEATNGLRENAARAVEVAEKLLAKAAAQPGDLLAANFLLAYLQKCSAAPASAAAPDQAALQAEAEAAYQSAGLSPQDVFAPVPKPPPSPQTNKSLFSNLTEGIAAFRSPAQAGQRDLVLYVLFALLVFTTLTTVQSVPYYALGIEIAPSYDGRTRVVTWRAMMDKVAGLAAPWVPVFCFLPMFFYPTEGLVWVALFACLIGIPSTVLMCWFVKERTVVSAAKKRGHPGLLTSMGQVAGRPEFLRILGLYLVMGITNGIFGQIGFFLNVYWVTGSALSGATLGAWLSMVVWAIGFGLLPLINWACKKFEKHRVLQFAVVWMAFGTGLKWWAMNPDHPEYQFVLPFFFSVGIATIFTVLPTMMADVTDVDEFHHGLRREGMFGAVMAFITKLVGTLTPVLAGAALTLSGFDPALEYHQEPSTILTLRILYSFVPAGLLLFALLLLRRYPLTRARVEEIKAALALRKSSNAAG